MHTDVRTETILKNQAHAGLQPARAWFNNVKCDMLVCFPKYGHNYVCMYVTMYTHTYVRIRIHTYVCSYLCLLHFKILAR